MKRLFKRATVLLGLSLCLGGMAFAQNVDHEIFGVEMGVGFGYDIASGNIDNASSVGIHLTLTDNLSAGFLFLTGPGTSLPASASLLTLDYGLADKLGLTLLLGRDTGAATPLTGVGAYYNIFEHKVQDALVNVVKTRIEYLFDPSVSLGNGDLYIGISLSTGM